MRKAYIIGSDMLAFGKYKDVTHHELGKRTFMNVLADAKINANQIQSVHFGNCLWGYDLNQQCIRGQVIMKYCGLDKVPVTNVEAACSTGSVALYGAYKDVLSGLYDCSLAIGVEKLFMSSKEKMLKGFLAGADVEGFDEDVAMYADVRNKLNIEIPEKEKKDRSVFMDVYATAGLWHMEHYGTTQEQLAIIAAKSHCNGALNPKAQYRFKMTPEEVLNDYAVTYPMTRSMCSPMTDGAASAIVCSEEYLKKLPQEVQDRAILIRAMSFISGKEFGPEDVCDDLRLISAAIRGTKKAYELAGLGPKDIDLVEVHDATVIGELYQYENMGFCPIGEAGPFAASGATKIGGKIPFNTSGGLISRGHPIAATGLAMVYELVTQLRGEAGERQVKKAKIGMAENGGGQNGLEEAACAITILEGTGKRTK